MRKHFERLLYFDLLLRIKWGMMKGQTLSRARKATPHSLQNLCEDMLVSQEKFTAAVLFLNQSIFHSLAYRGVLLWIPLLYSESLLPWIAFSSGGEHLLLSQFTKAISWKTPRERTFIGDVNIIVGFLLLSLRLLSWKTRGFSVRFCLFSFSDRSEWGSRVSIDNKNQVMKLSAEGSLPLGSLGRDECAPPKTFCRSHWVK